MNTRQNVVFLPGLLDDSAMWTHQTAGLADIAEPVSVDLVNQESIAESARWVLECAPEQFTLVGFSMGGYVAHEILRQAPGRVNGLALISTSARAERLAGRQSMIAHAEAGEYAALVDDLLPLAVHPDRATDHGLIDAIRDMALRIGSAAFVRQLKVIMSRPDSRTELSAITCPTLVICGRDDALTPVELSREMHDAIRGSQIAIEAVQKARTSPVCRQHFYAPRWDGLHHYFNQLVMADMEKTRD